MRDLIATPAAEQDPNVVFESLGATADIMRETSRRWSSVLKVQIALFFVSSFDFAAETRQHWPTTTPQQYATFIMWPLALSFRAIIQLNGFLAEVPHRLVRHRVFGICE